MARDANDRPYEDGQGRSLNPELTGDVLSPRWSTDDTDEQPAVQVRGNETYILPPEKDLLTSGMPTAGDPYGALGDAHGGDPYGALGDARAGDLLGDAPAGSDDPLSAHADLGPGPYDAPYGDSHDLLGDPGTPSDAAGEPGVPEENPYLPLDQGYEARYDDDGDDEKPKRGFLGSGWTGDSHGEEDREVRRRTRTLLLAAVVVVLVGVGAGFMLTGASSDDPCAGGRCAAGEVTVPTESAAPEDPPAAEEEESSPEPTASGAEEPVETEPVRPTARPEQPRRTREPSARPTRTVKPTAKSTDQPARESDETRDDTTIDQQQVGRPEPRESSTPEPRQSTERPSPSEEPETQEPAPTPTQEERRGLLDLLFPWR